MLKALVKDYAADPAIDETARAELPCHLPQRKDAEEGSPGPLLRLASSSVLQTRVAGAVSLIRACHPQLCVAHLGTGPRRLRVAGGSRPRRTDNATGSAAEASATASDIDSIPVEDIASLVRLERGSGLREALRAGASLLTAAARRIASLLPKAVRRAASRRDGGRSAADA